MTAIGLGWRIHSSSALVVALSGPAAAPVILHREEVCLIEDPVRCEPYHAAVGLSLDESKTLIDSIAEAATEAAASIIRGFTSSLGSIAAIGVVGGDRSVGSDLARILTKHALLHASERVLYEQAVIDGARREGLKVRTIPAKGRTTVDHAAGMLGVDLAAPLAAAGKAAGSPWQKDHREAAAAALVALQT